MFVYLYINRDGLKMMMVDGMKMLVDGKVVDGIKVVFQEVVGQDMEDMVDMDVVVDMVDVVEDQGKNMVVVDIEDVVEDMEQME